MTAFSYQLYSSRKSPLADTLPMLARLGYERVEGYGALYADPAEVEALKSQLAETGLAMPTGHFGLDMLEQQPDRVLEIAGALGIETIYCPFLPAEQRPEDAAGYAAFGSRLQEIAKPYRDAGLGFGWHNHAFEFQPLADGAVPQVAIFEGGPDLEWEADIAWVIKAGADPVEWIGAFRERITAVHVKDIAAPGENVDEDGWADVGQGTIDWPGLMQHLRRTPAKHFVLEHDNPSDAARFAERSIAAAKSF
jgi:sugar phosphate isomerase/epimerase